jgi:hypothetical protein
VALLAVKQLCQKLIALAGLRNWDYIRYYFFVIEIKIVSTFLIQSEQPMLVFN